MHNVIVVGWSRALFQSPDERGGYCDQINAVAKATAREGFNPLTSGAGTATRHPRESWEKNTTVSIP